MINLLAHDIIKDPYPTLNQMRESRPVCEISPGKIWVISKYRDVCSCLENYELYTVRRKKEIFSPDFLKRECHSDLFLATEEPPEYRARRAAIATPFLKHLDDLIPSMESTAQELINKALAKKNIEFVKDYAYLYIGTIISKITGLDQLQSIPDTQKWVHAVELLSTQNISKKQINTIESIILRQKSLFEDIINKKSASSEANDFINSLLSAKLNHSYLTVHQLINSLELLIRSGYQTSVHMLCACVIQLKQNPKIRQKLSESPVLIPVFIDELLRLHSSVPMLVRHTTDSVKLHGVTINKGDQVWLSLASANRDPREFSDPDKYDLTRDTARKNIAFGFGPHKCMGLNLAKKELEVALRHLIPVIPAMSFPSNDELKWMKTLLFRGFEKLPVRFK